MSNLEGILSNNFRNINVQGINKTIKYVKKNQTIQSVIDSITDASATNQYTVIIPPGYYDEQVLLSNYIHLQGSGIENTIISYDNPGAYWLHSPIDFRNTTSKICISDITIRKPVTAEISHPVLADTIGTAESYGELHRVKLISMVAASIVASDGWLNLKFYDCESWSSIDSFWLNPPAGKYITLYFFNHYHNIYPAAAPADSPNIFVSLKNERVKVFVFNSLIYGTSDRVGSEGPVAFKITDGTLRIYGTRIDLTNSDDATISHGIATASAATGADVKMYGGSINTNGGYDIHNLGNVAGIKLYGVKWTTHYGNLNTLCQGTIRSQGKSITLSAAGTFGPDDGNIFIIDPGGGARNLNPTGEFAPFTEITVINTADEAEAITFEPTFTASGEHDGDANASVLTDSGESWVTDQLVGKTITNTTDSSSGIITANTATTVTATLSGGTDNDWDVDDEYTIAPAGLNQAIAQNERGIFVYNGSGGWLKVFVG